MIATKLSKRIILFAALAACLGAGAVARADGIGVLLAPAGEQMADREAIFAEALVDNFVAERWRASFLHDDSPMVRSFGVDLPAVHLDDDWTPLASVLDRIATRLRLDYVLLASIEGEDEAWASGLLVVRGGESRSLSAVTAEGDAAAAQSLATDALAAVAQLPRPEDRADEPLPMARPDAPAADEPQTTQPPAEEPVVGETQDDPEPEGPALTPVTVADEPVPDAPGEPSPPTEPEPIDDALAEAEAAYQRGELEDAERLLAASMRESGASARAYLLRARLALGDQNREGAISDLKRAVAMDPSLADAQVWLGRLLAEKGLWQTARSHYERAVEAEPTHLEGLLGLARLYRDHGHRRKAIDLLTAAVDEGQESPALTMLLAELHGTEGNIELAERYFLRAARAAEGERSAAAWERLADLYVELHRHREALACYVQAAELNPSRASMVQRRYAEVMRAADGSLEQALTEGWQSFDDFARDGSGEREMVYRRLSRTSQQLEEALQFVESINPPAELDARHLQREFAYSLAVEASVLALSWLDLGDEVMLERAQSVHEDALSAFEELRDQTRG